ncbi:MAG: DUF1552 domain-containing protein [Polyangiaceae bacterium]
MNRRHFLRGLGAATLALPMLEAFRPGRAEAAATAPRLLVYYLPNGRRPEWWVPSAGGGLTFPGPAAALQPFAGRALSLVGLDNTAARQSPGAAHAMGTATVMTGTTIPDLGGLQNSISLDQIVANHHGQTTRFASLQWSAGEPGPCDVGGASCAYTQSISWADVGSPLIPTIDPAAAFDRLFRSSTDGLSGAEGELRQRSLGSVLDSVLDDATALQKRLGAADRERLDEYFTALEELEKSLAPASGPACEVPSDGPGGPLSYPDRVRAFHELIRLAFQCDQTRVLSFMIEFGLSGRSHDFIDAAGGHHALSHFGTAEQQTRLQRLETWHAEQIAHLLDLLVNTEDAAGGTLLDNTLVLVIPSMGAGSNHDHAQNCPLLFGAQELVATTGGQLGYGGAKSLANLHATLLAGFGIPGTFGATGAIFGDDGNEVLPGILV